MFFKSLFAGSVTGVFGGMVGLGGGVVAIPALMRVCRLGERQAIGTSLAAVAATSLAGGLTFFLSNDVGGDGGGGGVDVRAAALLAGASLFSAPVGARLAARVSRRVLRRSLGAFMLSASALVSLRNAVSEPLFPAPAPEVRWPFLGFCGVVTGLTSGALGVGGGVLLLPLLTLGPAALPQAGVLGTALAAMLPAATAGAVAQARLGQVCWRAAPGLVVGSAAGSVAGARAAVGMDERTQRWVVAGVMFLLSFNFLL